MATSKRAIADPVLAELDAIKRLLILALLKSGANQKQIAAALGVDQSQVSRMFSSGISTAGRGARSGRQL